MLTRKALTHLTPSPELEALFRGTTTPEEDEQLKAVIQEAGCPLSPIIADEHGNIIKEHRTYRICVELKIKTVWVAVLQGLTPEQKRHLAISLTCNKRHLSTRQNRPLIEAELRQRPSLSARALAAIFNIDHKTVQKIKDELIAGGEIPHLPVEGQDGKTYRVRGGLVPHEQVKEVLQKVQDMECPSGLLTAKKVRRHHLYQKRHKMIEAGASLPVEPRFRILHGDFRDLLQQAPEIKGQVQLVLTDPPWYRDARALWADLASLADDVLTPTGLLIAYAGVDIVPDAMRALGERLHFFWKVVITFPKVGGAVNIGRLNILNRYRDVLIYGKEPPQKDLMLVDCWESDGPEKDFHDYQQRLPDFQKFIENFTVPGDLVCDSMGGSFTAAAACKLSRRSFIGCDLDPDAVAIGRYRLNATQGFLDVA
jgi:hypothetical protein